MRRRGGSAAAVLAIAAVLAGPAAAHGATDREILIRGATVVTMDAKHTVIEHGRVLIGGNQIEAVWVPGKQPKRIGDSRLRRAVHVSAGPNAYLFPGLINLHDHPSFAALHAWPAPASHAIPAEGKLGTDRYDNRYEWNTNPPDEHVRLIENPQRVLTEPTALDLGSEAVKYSEVEGLLGGETSTQGASGDPASDAVLARNVESDVFNTRIARPRVPPIATFTGAPLSDFVARLNAGDYDAWMIHLAEGVRDADRRPGDSVSSRAEFQTLISKGLLTDATVIIHGLALERPDFAEMARAGAKLVWSPSSNLQLYGRTANVYEALAEGVLVSLGTDWTPSGSSSLLGELKVADRALRDPRVLGASHSVVPRYSVAGKRRRGRRAAERRLDRALADMVTRNPALTLGWSAYVGSIKPGKRADLLLIHRGRKQRANPYRALIGASEADVRLVTVDGQPIVASAKQMQKLSPGDFEVIPGALGGRGAIDVTVPGVPEGDETFTQIRDKLAAALAALGGDAQPPGGGTAPDTNTYSYLKAHWAHGSLAGLSDVTFRTVLTGFFGTDAGGRLNIEAIALKPPIDRDDDFLRHLLNGDLRNGLIDDPTPPFGLYPANLNHIGPNGNPLAGLP
jgi:5-methylthioadenosine/S-adenosylhomocysteine deaminase